VSSEASFPTSSFSIPCPSFSGDSLQMHGALGMASEWTQLFGLKPEQKYLLVALAYEAGKPIPVLIAKAFVV
jgi:hypothetical protein